MTQTKQPLYHNENPFTTAMPPDDQISGNRPSLREVFVGIDSTIAIPGPNQSSDIENSKPHTYYQQERSNSPQGDLSDQEENDQFWNRTVRLASVNTGQFFRKKTFRNSLPFVDGRHKSRFHQFRRALRKWFRHYLALLICMSLSAAAALAYYFLGPLQHQTLWMPIAVPGMAIGLYLLCSTSELVFLRLIRCALINPPWIVAVAVQSSSVWLRNFLFFGFLNIFLASWWEQYVGPPLISSELVEKICRSIWDIIVLVMIRNVFLKLLEQRIAWNSFGPEAEELYFVERFVLDVLCYQNPLMPSDIFARCFNDVLKTNFISKLSWMKAGPLSLPLEQNKLEQWRFSQDTRVEVVSQREVDFMSNVIYDEILLQQESKIITFESWESIFHNNKKAAKKSFRVMFSSDPGVVTKMRIERDDFKAAFHRIYRSRSVLTNKLTNFSNIYSLINTAICSLFWICTGFFVAYIFGYHLKDIIVLLSTIIFSFSFAMSKSISRIVESIIFVFGSRPYTVNDSVIIDNELYVVKQISLLETRLQNRTNQIIRMSNQKLCDMDIINLSYSVDNAISLVETELSITTSVDTIERLRASILTYTRRHSEQWKPRISIVMKEIKQSNSFTLRMYIESKLQWRERAAFREADLELKRHICQKMVKLGLCYMQPKQPIQLISAEAGNFTVSSTPTVSFR